MWGAMDAPASEELTATADGAGRVKANQLWIAAGALIAGVTVLSGIAASIFQFHDDSEVQREVFENIPSPLKLAFYTIIPLLILWGSVQLSYRVKNWERGAPDDRSDKPASKTWCRALDFRRLEWARSRLRHGSRRHRGRSSKTSVHAHTVSSCID